MHGASPHVNEHFKGDEWPQRRILKFKQQICIFILHVTDNKQGRQK